MLLDELKEKLAQQFDELTLLEILGVDTFDIVEAFNDKIIEDYDKLVKEVE